MPPTCSPGKSTSRPSEAFVSAPVRRSPMCCRWGHLRSLIYLSAHSGAGCEHDGYLAGRRRSTGPQARTQHLASAVIDLARALCCRPRRLAALVLVQDRVRDYGKTADLDAEAADWRKLRCHL